MIGEGVCPVKTLTKNHLYCEPPPQQPALAANGKKREGADSLPEFTVSTLSLAGTSVSTLLGNVLHLEDTYSFIVCLCGFCVF